MPGIPYLAPCFQSMAFFEEIKKQPKGIRQIMFGLCVVTTISLVGLVWYRSFETKLYALMDNKPQNEEASTFLAKDTTSPSLFASFSGLLGNIKTGYADLTRLFGKNNIPVVNEDNLKGNPSKLPLSGDK